MSRSSSLLQYVASMWSYRRLLRRSRMAMATWNSGPERGLGLFIVSSGRSGSTLLRRMLHAHPAISIPPESEDLLIHGLKNYLALHHRPEDLIKAQLGTIEGMTCMAHWKLDMDLLAHELRTTLARKEGFPAFHAATHRTHALQHEPAAHIHGDKTPLLIWYTDLIRTIYPETLIVHLVRHPLDAISSLATLSSLKNDLPTATNRWRNAARLYLQAMHSEGDGRVVSVKYEDLVARPEAVLGPLCGLLGVGYRPEMVNELGKDLGDTVLAHHHGVARPVNTSSIGIWRKRISMEQADRIMAECSTEARALGYSKDG